MAHKEGQATVDRVCLLAFTTLKCLLVKMRCLNAVASKDRPFGPQVAINTEEEAKDSDSDSKRRH